MLANLDDSVGAVLSQVEKSGLQEETLIFFLSDNGGPTRELTSSNLPLRGEKSHMHEGGLRVPMMVKWDGHLPQGKTYTKPVSSMDIFATSANLAGATIQHKIDGVDLMPFLTGKNDAAPHEQLFWRQGPRTALRYKNWKLVNMHRNRNKPQWELYDIEADLREQNDLAGARPEILMSMIERWEQMNNQMSEPLF